MKITQPSNQPVINNAQDHIQIISTYYQLIVKRI